jgi:hypothetical protein
MAIAKDFKMIIRVMDPEEYTDSVSLFCHTTNCINNREGYCNLKNVFIKDGKCEDLINKE